MSVTEFLVLRDIVLEQTNIDLLFDSHISRNTYYYKPSETQGYTGSRIDKYPKSTIKGHSWLWDISHTNFRTWSVLTKTIMVYRNGVLQEESVDYHVDGSTISFT